MAVCQNSQYSWKKEKKMERKGKLHLVESYTGPRSNYKNLTNEKEYASLKEAALKLHSGKKRLSEATTMDKMKKVLVENKIDEEVQKRVLASLQEAGADVDTVEIWQFPVSKINDAEHKNLNGRVYNKQLWENVVNKQTDVWKGGTGLANHPADDEDGDFMNQSIVWLDGFIGDDGIVYGIGTFVGAGGELARQIISVGGRVGFSTSGYGDFLKDGFTVDPDDYEIDRFADLVLNPSQGVYGDYKDSYKSAQAESTKKNGNSLTESKKRMQEDDEEKCKIKFEGEDEKEYDSFSSFISALKSHLKDKNELEDFEEIDVGEYQDHYQGNEKEKFNGVENTSVPDTMVGLEEGTTLSENLIVEFYTKEIKNINKESNRNYEKKLSKLEKLIKKLKKESLNEISKEKVNLQINKMIESIEKDVKKAMNEGFDARKLCEELEISSLDKLSNIKEKIEDFSSLEECLVKTTKEANKYKELYEEKTKSQSQEIGNTITANEKVAQLSEEISTLKTKIALKERENKKLAKENEKLNENLSKSTFTNEKQSQITESLKKSLEATKKNLDESNEVGDAKADRIEDLKTALQEATSLNKSNANEITALKEALRKSNKSKKELEEKVNKLEIDRKANKVGTSLSEKQWKERINSLNSRVKSLSEKNLQLMDLTEESEKTISALKNSLRETKKQLAEKTRKAEQLALKEEENTSLRLSLKKARSKLESINEDYESTSNAFEALKEKYAKDMKEKVLAEKSNKNLFKQNKKLAEEKAAERVERLKAERLARRGMSNIDESYTDFLTDNAAIEDYYDNFGSEAEFEGKDKIKTLKDAQTASLFSNELFSEDAEEELEESKNREREKDSMTLADMFK